jgi:hypothetical protein
MTAIAHELVSAGKLARQLGLATSTVRQYARKGLIPVARTTPGGHGRFVVEEVEAALAKKTEQARPKEAGSQMRNDPITPRSFAPVPITGEGELRLGSGQQAVEITEDWRMRLAIGAACAIDDEFGDLEPDPVVGVPSGARFILPRVRV